MKKIFSVALAAGALVLTACGDNTPSPKMETAGDTISYELGMSNAPSEAELKMFLSDPRTGSDSAYVEEFMKGFREAIEAGGDKKKAAYFAGLQAGAQLKMGMKQVEAAIYADDSTKHLSVKNFLAGFKAGMEGKRTHLKIDGKLIDRQTAMMDVNERINKEAAAAAERKYADNKEQSTKFIEAKSKEKDVNKLEGGTLYKVLTAGTGATPKDGQRVNVIYEGKLTDGTVFDASAQHPGPDGKSNPMVVGQMIAGFNAALKAMPVGSTWEIYIPYDQAYNDQQSPVIKPYSALIFTVTLVSIEEDKKPAN